jgi:uncharacterized membrane protein
MLAVVTALAAAFCWGTGDFLGGLSTRRATLWAVVAGSQAVGLAGAALVVAASGRPWPGLDSLWPVFAGGVAGAVAIASFYKALAIGTMSIVAPISATSAIVPLAVGLSRGERPTTLQAVGVVLAVLGVLLAASERGGAGDRRASRDRLAAGEQGSTDGQGAASERSPGERGDDGGRHAVDRRSIGLAVVAALGIGIMLVGYDAAAEGDALWAMLGGRVASATCFTVLLLGLRPSLAAPRRVWPLIAGVGITDTAANGLFAVATTLGLLSLVSVIGSLYPVVTVVYAYVILRERIATHQKLGVAGALLGVVLIAGG